MVPEGIAFHSNVRSFESSVFSGLMWLFPHGLAGSWWCVSPLNAKSEFGLCSYLIWRTCYCIALFLLKVINQLGHRLRCCSKANSSVLIKIFLLSNTKWSDLKTHVQVTLYRRRRLYLRICRCIHICMEQLFMKNEATDLKESKEECVGRSEGERKGHTIIIIVSK